MISFKLQDVKSLVIAEENEDPPTAAGNEPEEEEKKSDEPDNSVIQETEQNKLVKGKENETISKSSAKHPVVNCLDLDTFLMFSEEQFQ